MQKLIIEKCMVLFMGLLFCLPSFAAQTEAPLPDTFADADSSNNRNF